STVGGAVTIKTGDGEDLVTLLGFTAGGATSLDLGAANDQLAIDASTFNGTVTLDAGAGADLVLMDNTNTGFTTKFPTTPTFKVGAGDDQMSVGIPGDPNTFATFSASLSIDGAAGLDQVHILPGSGRNNVLPLAFVATPATEVVD